MKALRKAAIGFRAHSGWAAVVVLSEPADSPVVIHRFRFELIDPAMADTKQPYHTAESMDLPKAEAFIQRCTNEARTRALRSLDALASGLGADGYHVAACAVLLGSGRPLGSLATILASHALIHTAEGELFRDALRHAVERLALPLVTVRERELYPHAVGALRAPFDKLQKALTEMGRPIGPPWTQDQKNAALAAWLALHEANQ